MLIRIAITPCLEKLKGRGRIHLPTAYADAVASAGAVPVVIVPSAQPPRPEQLLDLADGLLLAGGDDLDPALWGERPHPATTVMDPRRQRSDLAWLAIADAAGMPVLGICLGCQEMAVARGGRLIQHVPDEQDSLLDHRGKGPRRAKHLVSIEQGSLLASVIGDQPLVVNSTHHQAVRHPGRNMRVVARSPDGLIEAIEDSSPGRFFLSVQWHPEDLCEEPRHRALFEALVGAAAAWRARHRPRGGRSDLPSAR